MRRIGVRVFASKPTVIVLLLELFNGYVTASTAGDALFGGDGCCGVEGSTPWGISADSILGDSFGDVRPGSDLNPVLVVEWFIMVSVLVSEALR